MPDLQGGRANVTWLPLPGTFRRRLSNPCLRSSVFSFLFCKDRVPNKALLELETVTTTRNSLTLIASSAHSAYWQACVLTYLMPCPRRSVFLRERRGIMPRAQCVERWKAFAERITLRRRGRREMQCRRTVMIVGEMLRWCLMMGTCPVVSCQPEAAQSSRLTAAAL